MCVLGEGDFEPDDPTVTCKQLGGPIPPIGSPAFCDMLPEIRAAIEQAGQSILGAAATLSGDLTSLGDFLSSLPIIGDLFKYLLGKTSLVSAWLAGVKEIPKVLSCLSPCPPTSYLYMVAVRTLLESLEKVRGGVDPGIWLTTDIRVSFEELRLIVDYVIKWTCPTEIPGIGEALEMYLAGTITDSYFGCLMGMNGGVWQDYVPVLASRRRRPETIECLQLFNRGVINGLELDNRFRGLGYIDPTERKLMRVFADELPSPSDLVRFAVRHVFEPSLTERFDFTAEMPKDFVNWHAKLGFGYPVDITDPVTGQQSTISWAQAHWQAHWVWPSPGQAYQMLFRLYPERDKRGEPPFSVPLSFTYDDLNYLLRGNDYPPYYRPYLASVAYSIPGIRFLRQLVKQKVWGINEVIDNLRKQGYNPVIATELATSIMRQNEEAVKKPKTDIAVRAAERAWRIGTIDSVTLAQMYQQLGVDKDTAAIRTLALETDYRANRVEREVKAIRQQYMSGAIPEGEVTGRLQMLGIVFDKAADYQSEWAVERAGPRRQLEAGRLIKDTADGLLTIFDLARRLHNLGYSDQDASILIGELEVIIANRLNKALLAAEKQAAKNQAAVARAAKEKLRQHQQLVQQLLKHGSPSDLAGWYRDNLITRTEVSNRLIFAGWPQSDIDRLLDEALIKAKLQSPPKEPPHNGPPIPPRNPQP